MNGKARRVGRKVKWVRNNLEQRGCKECGFSSWPALRHRGVRRTPSKAAYDDAGRQTIDKIAQHATVMCLNCIAIAGQELKEARILGA